MKVIYWEKKVEKYTIALNMHSLWVNIVRRQTTLAYEIYLQNYNFDR